MNKEELIRKLQMVYVGDRNAFNELVGYYDGLKQGIEELQQENKQLNMQLDQALKDYDEEMQKNIKSIEILKQPMLNYASCVKALDEIEEILKGDSNE